MCRLGVLVHCHTEGVGWLPPCSHCPHTHPSAIRPPIHMHACARATPPCLQLQGPQAQGQPAADKRTAGSGRGGQRGGAACHLSCGRRHRRRRQGPLRGRRERGCAAGAPPCLLPLRVWSLAAAVCLVVCIALPAAHTPPCCTHSPAPAEARQVLLCEERTARRARFCPALPPSSTLHARLPVARVRLAAGWRTSSV